jgi:hypothetical protein
MESYAKCVLTRLEDSDRGDSYAEGCIYTICQADSIKDVRLKKELERKLSS